jgi:hypothetical protein
MCVCPALREMRQRPQDDDGDSLNPKTTWQRDATLKFQNQTRHHMPATEEGRRVVLLQRDGRTATYHKTWLRLMGYLTIVCDSEWDLIEIITQAVNNMVEIDVIVIDGGSQASTSLIMALIRRAKTRAKVVQVVESTKFDEDAFFDEALLNGVDGVVRTNDMCRTFIRTVEGVGRMVDRARHMEHCLRLAQEEEASRKRKARWSHDETNMTKLVRAVGFDVAAEETWSHHHDVDVCYDVPMRNQSACLA